MARWACVDVTALPLQLLLRAEPSWRERPAAEVDREHPGGQVRHANRLARRQGVHVGQRLATALSTCPDLRARTIPDAEVRDATARIIAHLLDLSPRVEPAPTAGLFWLDADHLQRLFGSLEAWHARLLATLRDAGFHARAVVGFSRFGTYALARGAGSCCVLPTPPHERAATLAVRLDRLPVPARDLAELARLGLHTVGDLERLPLTSLRPRTSPLLVELARLARGDLAPPLAPYRAFTPPVANLACEPAEASGQRLLFRLKAPLADLLTDLRRAGWHPESLTLHLTLDHAPPSTTSLRPGAPTWDLRTWLDLMRLRLDRLALPAPICEARLVPAVVRPEGAQLGLFARAGRRDPAAAARAFARLRASFGDEVVSRAVLGDGHLPEATFRWIPCHEVPAPQARGAAPEPAPPPRRIRRIFTQPRPLATPPAPGVVPGVGAWAHPPVRHLHGPFLFNGGWWRRWIERRYHLAELADGSILWLYFDGVRRRVRLHGVVE